MASCGVLSGESGDPYVYLKKSPDAGRRRDGRSLVAVDFSPSTTYGIAFLRRSKNPKAPRASADPGSAVAASI
jgi:hypothetical protein